MAVICQTGWRVPRRTADEEAVHADQLAGPVDVDVPLRLRGRSGAGGEA
jgi:hypothetical protein